MKDFDIIAYLETCGYKTQTRINAINAAQDILTILRRENRPMRAGEVNKILMAENPHNYDFYVRWDGKVSGWPYYSTARVVQQAKKLAKMGLVAIEKVACKPYTIEVPSGYWDYAADKWVDTKKTITITEHSFYHAI